MILLFLKDFLDLNLISTKESYTNKNIKYVEVFCWLHSKNCKSSYIFPELSLNEMKTIHEKLFES